jgi:hypothetical protein
MFLSFSCKLMNIYLTANKDTYLVLCVCVCVHISVALQEELL